MQSEYTEVEIIKIKNTDSVNPYKQVTLFGQKALFKILRRVAIANADPVYKIAAFPLRSHWIACLTLSSPVLSNGYTLM